MSKKTPYDIIKSRYVTEKASTLSGLKDNQSNPCVTRCKKPKYLFLVDKKANKREIADAIEQIYAEQGIQVKSVNTITIKPKKKRIRGRLGFKSGFKKAIVTLGQNDELGDTI